LGARADGGAAVRLPRWIRSHRVRYWIDECRMVEFELLRVRNHAAKLEAELCWEKREHEKTAARLCVLQAKEDARAKAREERGR